MWVRVTSSTTTLRTDRSHDADVSQGASIEGPPNKLSSWSAAMTQGVFKKTGYRNAQKANNDTTARSIVRAEGDYLSADEAAGGKQKGPARWRAVASRTEGRNPHWMIATDMVLNMPASSSAVTAKKIAPILAHNRR